MTAGARRFFVNGRALLLAGFVIACAVPALADDEYRVAAIIFAEQDPKALIEDSLGEQAWYETGENLGQQFTIVGISVDSVTLAGADGQSVLMLRGSRSRSSSTVSEEQAPPTEVSRTYAYVGLMSEIKANTPKIGESQAATDARTMNRVLGLADTARITAIDRVEVSSAAEARSELQQRLTSGDPIRLAIEGDELKVLYVTPN